MRRILIKPSISLFVFNPQRGIVRLNEDKRTIEEKEIIVVTTRTTEGTKPNPIKEALHTTD